MRNSIPLTLLMALMLFVLGCNGGCKKPEQEPEVVKQETPPEKKKAEPKKAPPKKAEPAKETPKSDASKSDTAKSDYDATAKSQQESEKGGGQSGDGKSGGGNSGGGKSGSGDSGGGSAGGGDSGGGTAGGADSSGGPSSSGGGGRGQKLPSLAESGGLPKPSASEALAKGEKELRAAQTASAKGDKTAAAKHAMLAWEATQGHGGNAECRAVTKQAEVLLEKFGALPSSDDVDLSRVLIR